MKQALKSSASSRRVALRSTSAGATKAERIVTYTPDPKTTRKFEAERRARLAALETAPAEDIDFSDIPKLDEQFWARAIRPAMFPPVPIDGRVVEWFLRHGGSRGTLMLDINRVLQDYIRAEERKAARKKAG